MLTVSASSKPFIAAVEGINLAAPLDDATFKAILDAWVTYPVLMFPDQDLDSDAQQVFAERFGRLVGRTRPKGERGKEAQDNPYMMLVSNVRDDDGTALGAGDYPLPFHTDGCFNPVPSLATFLYGIEVPGQGGETLFVDMNEVYDALTPATQERLLGLRGVNYHTFSYERYDPESAGGRPITEVVTNAVHPMVISHPLSNKPIVYANRHNTYDIAGMERAAAQPILDEIFTAIEQPARLYTHKWRVGELVMWDNRAVQHARAACLPEERRMLRRFAVEASDTPTPFRQ
jgi:taurine dioxygenase